MSGSKNTLFWYNKHSIFFIRQIQFHDRIGNAALINLADVCDGSRLCVFQIGKKFFPPINKMTMLTFYSFNAVSHSGSFPYTNSERIISSARLRMLLTALTHAICSWAFNSSVIPSAAFICSMMVSNRFCACSFRSARYVQSLPAKNQALYD